LIFSSLQRPFDWQLMLIAKGVFAIIVVLLKQKNHNIDQEIIKED